MIDTVDLAVENISHVRLAGDVVCASEGRRNKYQQQSLLRRLDNHGDSRGD